MISFYYLLYFEFSSPHASKFIKILKEKYIHGMAGAVRSINFFLIYFYSSSCAPAENLLCNNDSDDDDFVK